MTHRTITINEYHNDNIVHVKATDAPNKALGIDTLRPYFEKGYKLVRSVTNVANGTRQSMLIK